MPQGVEVRVLSRAQKRGTWRSWLARIAYIDEVGGSNPSVPTRCRGSSVVEQLTENQRVASSILARGTNMRVSYNGHYATLPRLRRRFDSAHPLKRQRKVEDEVYFIACSNRLAHS